MPTQLNLARPSTISNRRTRLADFAAALHPYSNRGQMPRQNIGDAAALAYTSPTDSARPKTLGLGSLYGGSRYRIYPPEYQLAGSFCRALLCFFRFEKYWLCFSVIIRAGYPTLWNLF